MMISGRSRFGLIVIAFAVITLMFTSSIAILPSSAMTYDKVLKETEHGVMHINQFTFSSEEAISIVDDDTIAQSKAEEMAYYLYEDTEESWLYELAISIAVEFGYMSDHLQESAQYYIDYGLPQEKGVTVWWGILGQEVVYLIEEDNFCVWVYTAPEIPAFQECVAKWLIDHWPGSLSDEYNLSYSDFNTFTNEKVGHIHEVL